MASSMLTAEVSAAASKEADVDEALKSALHSCANDPDFAIICDFLQKFSKDLGLDLPNFKLLLQWLTKTDEGKFFFSVASRIYTHGLLIIHTNTCKVLESHVFEYVKRGDV